MNCVGPNAPAQEPFSRSGLHVAAMENFQRGEKFVAEIILPAADAGERRGRADHRPVAADACRSWISTPQIAVMI